MNILAFDIETIPDVESGRRLYDLPNLSDQEMGEWLFAKRREEANGSDFLPLHLHRVLVISAVLKTSQHLRVWSLGEPASSEKDLLERFFAGIEKYQPILVSWNGNGFDLPVIRYRALLHGISSPRYWELGDDDPSFRWNNYISRYHYRHTDIMDILSGYQPRATAKLDEIAVMLGCPGKMGMHGDQVWPSYLEGNLEKIRNYCETDALNTYLIYLRFRLIQGKLTSPEYQALCEETKQHLEQSHQPHLQEFVHQWK